ncbi:hypothetical protein MPER_09652 [Moniliophthora perniciosa FA553]|nr:hypothetical protein MPER_09652 [Moniliophthora perniciosa FA553]
MSAATVVTNAARATIQALSKNRINCCILGSTACLIYGMENRAPNDVDIVLLTCKRRAFPLRHKRPHCKSQLQIQPHPIFHAQRRAQKVVLSTNLPNPM